MTNTEKAIEAIKALKAGEWDNIHLMAVGDLFPTKEENIKWIIEYYMYDEIHDGLKDEGYSTGSEEEYDKLTDELRRRLAAFKLIN